MPGIPDPPKPVEFETESESEETDGSESESEEAESESEEMSVDGGDIDGVLAIMNHGDLSTEERILRIGAELLEGKEEWEKLRLEALEIHVKQLELRKAQTKLVLDALNAKRSGGQ